ncbi:MAG: 8-oxo-dGTP diphosphatase MutT [Verrucomicrobia bacterium]|nr:8-oxo-dGTP diphosphatase MutT [Verrucomicrobiota bacterium]
MQKIIEVAAGLVFREGKLLITQRCKGAHLAGLWEFPGGKREPGETYEECLRRELQEELGSEVTVGELIESLSHDYLEKSVHLKFFRCLLLKNEPSPIGCDAVAWITAAELDDYPFPEADARLLEKLRESPELWRTE